MIRLGRLALPFAAACGYVLTTALLLGPAAGVIMHRRLTHREGSSARPDRVHREPASATDLTE